MRRWLILGVCGLCLQAAEVRRLTLDEALALARSQNSQLKMAQQKVDEAGYKVKQARANYYPIVQNNTGYFYSTELQRLVVPAGALGVLPDAGPLPAAPITLFQGARNYLLSSTSVGQPLTQIYRIKQGENVARAETQISQQTLRRGQQDLAFGVTQLYYGLLIAQRQLESANQKIASAEENLRDAANAVETGNALSVAAMGRRAQLSESRQAKLGLEIQISDLMMEMNDALGLRLDTQLEVSVPAADSVPPPVLATAIQQAITANPQVREAEQLVQKARGGVGVAKADYIPEINALAQYIVQSGVPFFPTNNFVIGGQLKFDLWDWGKRANLVKERQSQLATAEENLKRARSRVSLEVEKSHRKLDRSTQLVAVAREALAYRSEAARIAKDQSELGTATRAVQLEAEAARAAAEADVFAAELGARLAKAELDRAIGAQ